MNESTTAQLLSGTGEELSAQIAALVESYRAMKQSYPSSYDYGFVCEECGGGVVARDRKKLVRNGASQTLCWDCMDSGADLYAPSTQTLES